MNTYITKYVIRVIQVPNIFVTKKKYYTNIFSKTLKHNNSVLL